MKDIDVGHAVYELLGRLFAEFGFNYDEMPYVEFDEKRITPESLFPNLRK